MNPKRSNIRKAHTPDGGDDDVRGIRMAARVVRQEVTDDNEARIEVIASTDEPVDMGSHREILVHEEGAIDTGPARTVLFNHSSNQPIGGIKRESFKIENGELRAVLLIDANARAQTGVRLVSLINRGHLEGVSIGYSWRDEDIEVDREERVVIIRKWQLREISITPTQADIDAKITARARTVARYIDQGPHAVDERSFTDHHEPGQPPKEERAMEFEKWLKARGLDPDKLTKEQREALKKDFDALRAVEKREADEKAQRDAEAAKRSADEKAQRDAGDEAKRAQEIADERKAREGAERELQLIKMAQRFSVDTGDKNLREFETLNEGIEWLMERSTQQRGGVFTPNGGGVHVSRDEGDKFLRHAEFSFRHMAGLSCDQTEADRERFRECSRPMNGRSLVRNMARMNGVPDADYVSDVELAARFAGQIDLRTFGRRDAANQITASFGNVLANTSNLAIAAGLDDYDQQSWDIWATQRNVTNFKQVTNAGLAAGRLTETPENEAFPELTQADGGYNSTLGVYGATISLTFQMIVNDELGVFMQRLRRIGFVAGETVDRQVYSTLLNASWGNDTTSSADLATKENLDKTRADLREKLSPAGERMGIVARYLLHDPAEAINAQAATGELTAGGETSVASRQSRQIQTVESHWIGDTSLESGAGSDDYYLTGNPRGVDTVLVNFLEGVGFSPIVMPYDPGAVAAEKWKIMLPFTATAATHTDGDGNTRVTGIQKGTA